MDLWVENLLDSVAHQVKTFFSADLNSHLSASLFNTAIRHTQECISGFSTKSDRDKNNSGGLEIRPFYSKEYAVFLYWLSHELYLNKDIEMASWIYYLNKALNCVELFYEVNLPSIWYCEHPLGSVMGRAQYGDCFFFYQGCTVGGNFEQNGKINYPVIGEHVKMLSNSKIIGSSQIGNNVIVAANSYIKDMDVPDGVIVFGSSPNLVFKHNYFMDKCQVDTILSK